jgi:hypothetical protein
MDMLGWIMPFVSSDESLPAGLPAKKEGADDVEAKRENETAHDERRACPKLEAIKLAQEQAGHERGLERADAAAGFGDLEGASRDLYEVASLESRDAKPAKNLHSNAGHDLHEILSQSFSMR